MKKFFIAIFIVYFIFHNIFLNKAWADTCSSCSSDSCWAITRGACINWSKTWTITCTACTACNPPSSYWWCTPALWGICDNWWLWFKTRWWTYAGWTTSTSCQVCWNWWKEWTEQCDDSNTTNWDWCSSTCITEYIDIWLKIFDWSSIVKIAIEPWAATSKLRIAKWGTIYWIVLVDPADAMASKMRINTSAWIKALRKLP